MSRSIDERLVEMKFDNTLFEKNVATSIGTLEKLKTALDISGAADSFNRVEKSISAADFSKLASSVEAISDRFSAFGIVGMTVLQDLTRAAENLGGKILDVTFGKLGQAMTQIQTGGWSRATNIDKAKFAIEGLGYAWEDLEHSISEAVNETRFGFDEAATAASQLVASNVAVGDEMDNALKSIANVASQTGDEYSSIAHIYTTIAGNGKLMTEQLNMFSYRGLNAAALIAKSMGKTEQEIREMTTKGEISFKQFSDAMNEALGEGAKRANETFEGSLANMKAALSRIGQPFAEVIRKYMPPVFNDLKDVIKEIKTITDPLATSFENFFMHATIAFRVFLKDIDLTPLQTLADAVLTTMASISEFISEFRFITETTDMLVELEGTLTFLFWQISNVGKVMIGLFTDIANVVGSALIKVNGFEFIYSIIDLIASLSEKVIEVVDDIRTTMNRDAITDKIASFLNGVIDGLTMVVRLASVVLNAAIKPLASVLVTIGGVLLDSAASLGEWITRLKEAAAESGFFEKLEVVLRDVFEFIGSIARGITTMFGGAFTLIMSVVNKLTDRVFNAADRLKATFDAFKETDAFKNLSKSIADLKYDFNQLRTKGLELIKKVFEKFDKSKVNLPTGPFQLLLSILTRIAEVASKFISWIVDKFDVDAFLAGVESGIDKIGPVINGLAVIVKGVLATAFNIAVGAITGFVNVAGSAYKKAKELWGAFKETKAFDTLKLGFEAIKEKASEAKDKIVDVFTNDETGEFEFPEITWENVKQTWFDIWGWIKDRFFDVKAWIEEKISNITGKEFHFPEIDLQPIKETFDKIKEWFTDIFTNDDTGEFELSWDGIKQGFEDAISWVQEKVDAIKELFSDMFAGKIDASGSQGSSGSFMDKIKEHIPTFKDLLDIIGKIGKVVLKIEGIKALVGIFETFFQIGQTMKNVSGTVNEAKNTVKSIKDFVKSASKEMKAKGNELNARAILEIAAAIGIVALAFVKLSELSWDQVKIAAVAIVVITGALAALFALVSQLNKKGDTKGTSAWQETIKGLVAPFAKGFKDIGKGINKAGMAVMIAAITYAVNSIIGIIKDLSQYTWNDVKLGVGIVGLVMLELVGAMALLDKLVTGNFLQNLGAAEEMAVFVGSIKTLCDVFLTIAAAPKEGMVAAGIVMTLLTGLLVGAIGVLNYLTDNSFGESTGLALEVIAFAYSVKTIVDAFLNLATNAPEDIEPATLVMTVLMGVLAVAVGLMDYLSSDSGFWSKAGTSLEVVTFAESVRTVCDGFIEIAEVDSDKLGGATVVMTVLMGVLATAVTLMDYFTNGDLLGDIGNAVDVLAFAYGVKLISSALVSLTEVPTDKLAEARNAISLVTATVAILAYAMGTLVNSGKGDVPGMAAAFLGIIAAVAMITLAISSLKDIDPTTMEAIGNSLSKVVLAISALSLVIGELGKSGIMNAESLLGSLGTVGIATLITALAGIIASLIDMIPGAKEWMDGGAEILESFASWIGRFFGGLIGSFLDAIGDQIFGDAFDNLMTFPTLLGQFIDELEPVLDKMSGFDSTGADAVLAILGTIAACFGAELLGSFTDWLLGEDSLEKIGSRLSAFGQAIVDYSAIVDGNVSEEAVAASARAGQMLIDLEASMPNEGGLLSKIIGDNNKLDKLGDRLVPFGTALAAYSAEVDGKISEEAVAASARAGQILIDLEKELPNTGGILAWITGEGTLDDFGERIKKFGEAIVGFCETVDGKISQDAANAAYDAGSVLSKLEEGLTTQGGVLEFFTGESGLDDFGSRLEAFGGHIVKFSDLVTGKVSGYNAFDNVAVSAAIDTLSKLLDFVSRIEGDSLNADGTSQFTSLTNNIFDFGTLVDKIKDFYEQVGAEILSDDTFNASGIIENCKAAGERLAEEIVKGLTTKLEEIDEGKQTPIMRILIKALTDAIGNDRFLSSVRAKGQTIGTTLVEGLMKIFTDEEEEEGFPAFIEEFVGQFKDMIYTILSSMTNAAPTFQKRAEDWMKSLKAGIDVYRASIISWLMGIASSVLSNYGIRTPEFFSAGQSWMNALYNGISTGSVGVYRLAYGIADDINSIINGAVNRASAAPSGLMLSTDDYYTFDRSMPMLNTMNALADTGLRTATALTGAMDSATSNGQMAFQQLQSLAGIQNGAFSLSRDAGAIADSAAASMSRTVSLAKSASMTNPITNQVYVKDSNDTLEALNGMRRDIKVLTENMANMQMVLDSGALVGQLSPGIDKNIGQKMKYKERWA